MSCGRAAIWMLSVWVGAARFILGLLFVRGQRGSALFRGRDEGRGGGESHAEHDGAHMGGVESGGVGDEPGEAAEDLGGEVAQQAGVGGEGDGGQLRRAAGGGVGQQCRQQFAGFNGRRDLGASRVGGASGDGGGVYGERDRGGAAGGSGGGLVRGVVAGDRGAEDQREVGSVAER